MLKWKWQWPQRELWQCFAVTLATVFAAAWIELRPLALFFILLLCLFLYNTQCNFCLAIPPEFERKCTLFLQRLRAVRQEKPKMFCAISSCCLGTLAIIGHLVSGTVLVFGGLLIAALVSTKYDFKLIRMETKSYNNWTNQLITDNENDDYLPEDTESNMFVLERACDLSTLSLPVDETIDEEHSDDWPSELMLPDNSLADVDDNSSSNDDEVADLLPVPAVTAAKAKEKLAKDIEFKRGHFKCDSSLSTSSSSSEESLSKGLQFPDMSAVDSALKKRALEQRAIEIALSTSPSSLVGMGARLLPGFVSELMQWSPASPADSTQSEPLNLSTSSSASAIAETQMILYNKTINNTVDNVPERRVVTSLDTSDESDFEIL